MRDKSKFIQELVASYELRGKEAPSKLAVERWWELVGHFPTEMVIQAMRDHDRASQYLPQPSDIIKALESMDGRPGAEEAWGDVLASINDDATVVWTEETAIASEACQEHLEIGDKIAARVAFKEKYEKLVSESRKAMKPVKWLVSYGEDPSRRDHVVRMAVAAGKLPESHLNMLPPKNDGRVYGLIAGTIAPDKKSKVEMQLSKLREKLNAPKEVEKTETDRERTARLKAEAQKLIDERME